MIDQHKPFGTGFGARTIAADVLDGIDRASRRAIVTGGHSGLGLETTKALAAAGAEVIVAARDAERAGAALRGLPAVAVAPLDLSDLASVRGFAERLLTAGRHIDVLINNAGIMACPETRVGPGWEAQFVTNHLGHFALTHRLWPLRARDLRILGLASRLARLSSSAASAWSCRIG